MERAGDLLKRFFEQYNIGREGEKYVSFFSSWGRIAGRDLAAHSQIADIRHNAAVVEVDHPAWMQLLQMKQKAVLERMQSEFPELGITSVQMRLVDRPGWTGSDDRRERGEMGPSTARAETRSAGTDETAVPPEPPTTDASVAGEHPRAGRARFEGLLQKLKEQVDAREHDRRTH